MRNRTKIGASLVAAALLLSAPAMAQVNINVDIPGVRLPQPVYVNPQPVYVAPQPVYVQPRPIYVPSQYEQDWRERQRRALEWRNNPQNHGHVVSMDAHERKEERKANKHYYKELKKQNKHNKHKEHDD